MAATTTIIGNTTADVELRYSQAGKAIGSVTVAVADRIKDKTTGAWVDGKVWFARCTLWGDIAENAAASITKGTRVIAQGRIEQDDWTDKEGNKRTTVGVNVDEIGASLKYATAQVTRAISAGQPSRGQVADEPWAPATHGSEVPF